MKLSFVNYRKEFPGSWPLWKKDCISAAARWIPSFNRRWYNELWILYWRGYALELDMRKDVWGDMFHGRTKPDKRKYIKVVDGKESDNAR
jgi:hypothetical protein